MRKATKREYIKFLKKWFRTFDKDLFDGFFKDKKITITVCDLEKPKFYGMCCWDDKEIIISRYCLEQCPASEVKETLLHEMTHLFVAWAYPNGERHWGDRTKTFKYYDKSFQRLRKKRYERKR